MSVMTSVSHPSWVLGDETLEVAGCSPATVRQQPSWRADRQAGGSPLIDCRITAWGDGPSVGMEDLGRRGPSCIRDLRGGADRRRLVSSVVFEGQMRPLAAWTTPTIPGIGHRWGRAISPT